MRRAAVRAHILSSSGVRFGTTNSVEVSQNKTNNARASATANVPIADQASIKTRRVPRGVNSRSTRRARPRLAEPTPRAPVPSRTLDEAESCYEPPRKLEGAPHETAYIRGTYSRVHTQTHTNTNKHTTYSLRPAPRAPGLPHSNYQPTCRTSHGVMNMITRFKRCARKEQTNNV